MPAFDRIVITAANEAQARGYRAQVVALKGRLAPEIDVVPDPGGRRVGSLGATVNVLRKFPVQGRVLICHSGGDSKRLPAYAALGKAFVPVPQADGTCRSLFEAIVDNMSRLVLPKRGVLVVCGDLAPEFAFGRCDFSRAGVTGVGYYDGPGEARRHGVYLPAKKAPLARVDDFLQKPDVTKGRHVIDTGILWLDAPTAHRLAASGWTEGDLYEKFAAELVKGFAPFHVNVVPKCTFFHLGSSAELLAKLGGPRQIWVDGCSIPEREMKLAGGNIVTGVPRSYGKVRLAKGECLLSLPIGEKAWKHIRYRATDTFKTDGLWEKHRLGELLPQVDPDRLFGRVVVEKPLRVDIAGGWSDTPPICHELGGRVLNMAVTLNGKLPVRVEVRPVRGNVVEVDSVDLGEHGVYRTDAEIADHADPHDWCALVKSALTVVGYKVAEGGLGIRISADVPKGSGLGTSSILGATLVEALGRFRGQNYTWREVSELTLRLEQEMCTGGGWQDQMGGLLPGVKLVSSEPGAKQVIRVKTLDAGAADRFRAFLGARALLYFTGRKRMARNVLRGVLDFYAKNPAGIASAIIARLKREASEACSAIERGDWKAFATAVNGYWMSKKALDPGSTNPVVESIIARIAPWTSAVTLCGAGGGGFMFIVARDATAKCQLKRVLESYPPVKAGCFYAMELA